MRPSAPELSPFRALLFGWHGSRERHLRILAKHYASRGGEAIVHVPRTFFAMSRPDGWQREANDLARTIVARDRADRRPLVIHAFSNAGFWSMTALLAALAREADGPRLAGSVIDSAPGFPERVSFRFTAKYASRAMLPGLLAAIGLRPAHRHPILTPPIAALLGAWHAIAPRQVAFMESSQALVRAAHRGLPLLLVWGGEDELVPAEHVERFADASQHDSDVERLYYSDGAHVRHLFAHRHEYLAAVDRFLTRAVGRAPAV